MNLRLQPMLRPPPQAHGRHGAKLSHIYLASTGHVSDDRSMRNSRGMSAADSYLGSRVRDCFSSSIVAATAACPPAGAAQRHDADAGDDGERLPDAVLHLRGLHLHLRRPGHSGPHQVEGAPVLPTAFVLLASCDTSSGGCPCHVRSVAPAAFCDTSSGGCPRPVHSVSPAGILRHSHCWNPLLGACLGVFSYAPSQ